jgi:hypothetical protein
MMRGVVLLMLAAGPVAAQPLFSPPAGCEVFATVQAADCTVEQVMRCDGQDGVTKATLYSDGGDFISRTDAEGQWLFSYDGYDGTSSSLVEPQADPSLLSDLLGTGRNVYDFTTVDGAGVVTRFVGKEALLGDEVVVDGVRLLRTENQMQAFAADGSWLWSVVAREYVSPDWGVFFGGEAMWNTPADGEYPYDSTPVEISQPGMPGYLATVPAYGCAG